MTSPVKRSNYRDYRVLVGDRNVEGSSVDGVQTESCRETEILKAHPLSVLLYLTMKEGDVISHPAFDEEAV